MRRRRLTPVLNRDYRVHTVGFDGYLTYRQLTLLPDLPHTFHAAIAPLRVTRTLRLTTARFNWFTVLTHTFTPRTRLGRTPLPTGWLALPTPHWTLIYFSATGGTLFVGHPTGCCTPFRLLWFGHYLPPLPRNATFHLQCAVPPYRFTPSVIPLPRLPRTFPLTPRVACLPFYARTPIPSAAYACCYICFWRLCFLPLRVPAAFHTDVRRVPTFPLLPVYFVPPARHRYPICAGYCCHTAAYCRCPRAFCDGWTDVPRGLLLLLFLGFTYRVRRFLRHHATVWRHLYTLYLRCWLNLTPRCHSIRPTHPTTPTPTHCPPPALPAGHCYRLPGQDTPAPNYLTLLPQFLFHAFCTRLPPHYEPMPPWLWRPYHCPDPRAAIRAIQWTLFRRAARYAFIHAQTRWFYWTH